jgi:thymidylate kinase
MSLYKIQNRGADDMRKKGGNGWLFVLAGIDGSGKTTAGEQASEDLGLIYIKGMGGDNFWGRIAKKYAKTFLFLLEILYITYFPVRRALKNGDSVLLDRYFFAVASHIPDVNTRINQYLIKLCAKFIYRPDFLIYLEVQPKERIRRLKMGAYNRFHETLIHNPKMMVERDKAYSDLVHRSHLFFHFLDNTELSVAETGKEVERLIKKFIEMRGE